MSINLLVSYPRSGSTFIRYIIEYLTKRPTRGPPTSTNLIDAPLNPEYKDKKTVVYKIHGQDQQHQDYIQAFLTRNIPLLFLMRNPMEMFPRHTDMQRMAPLVSDPPMPLLSTDISYFFDNIKTYHSYEGKKQVFYYEELSKDPESVIRQLSEFLDVDHDGIERKKFMDNFEEHFHKSRTAYNKYQSGLQTALLFLDLSPEPQDRTFTDLSVELLQDFLNEHPDSAGDLSPHPLSTVKIFNEDETALNTAIEAALIPTMDKKSFQVIEYELNRGASFEGMGMSTVQAQPGKEPFPFLRIHHGSSILGSEATLVVRVATDKVLAGAESDGKTTVKYAPQLTPKQRKNFWTNFKELCGEGNWEMCERYMNIKYGDE